MKTIALIIPYFGSFKNYFPLFLISCKYNPTVDWFIFTDIEEDYDWPINVHITKIGFEEFRECVQANFNFPICLDRPYKLCDFKPAYGEILEQYLTEYDFWGYCDCDLIFGNLRAFLSENILDNYLKIFTRGHLSLYHNDKEINSFYKTQKLIDYKKVLQSSKVHAFDEWGGLADAGMK